MSDFKFWGWNKKPRTMLRYVKPGDIFCFQLNNEKYGFGRIISKIMTGHVAEIFDFFSSSPTITEDNIKKSKRKIEPVVIDTYGLFDRKGYPNSDWRIIGHQNNYTPINVEGVYFTFGIGNSCKKKDIFDNTYSISEEEAKKLPELIPYSDYHIKELLGAI
ncbi:immunity 26/phosphotriesterase HocA family protein [Providencia stuartii]|uniref:immunity 26/phosphotriesterase HocA family protein n=1 Tax=Morganellaceae TaxID=1903414 RepID=UPI001BD99D23|nr:MULTISPECIES: immunity 26/phosphotriesterase HocA family protein [Morganellaceae]ELR5298836.1 immunity 26/phosphotriesterase HocA family protein [Providencia stuartii]MBT0402338.1 immunity 26/phosphotriesterase HocA family protein [Morganella morganii subsp. morganii]MDW7587706.1 immunity 26/phosphotriesterase HocA family protein [Providencia sp. 2023EL-00965]